MCIFTGPVQKVSATRIYVADVSKTVRSTVYQLNLENEEDVAMVLPVPGNNDLDFVDLSSYPEFFKHLDDLFPDLSRGVTKGVTLAYRGGGAVLPVVQVGDYEASWVPSQADFERLDPRFRIDPTNWDKLPNYENWSFAVFQIRPGVDRKFHPMAYCYKPAWPQELFFPTVHVHDDDGVPRNEMYDHQLYYSMNGRFAAEPQVPPASKRAMHWRASERPLASAMRPKSAAASLALEVLTVPYAPVARLELYGPHPNTDHVLASRPENHVEHLLPAVRV